MTSTPRANTAATSQAPGAIPTDLIAAISVRDVTKSHGGTVVLKGVNLAVRPGSFTVLSGPSGSGKTTLLNLVSGMDAPDSGAVIVAGIEITSLTARDRERFRAGCGHVFQRSGLLGGLTLRENIEAVHALTGQKVDPAWVLRLASRLGIVDVLDTPARRVSGGQAQRAAIVRALAHRPDFVFADEPTASLDSASKRAVHDLLSDAAAQEGMTVLMVSHDAVSHQYANDEVTLVDGHITTAGITT